MTMLPQLAKVLQYARKRIYVGPVQHVVRKTKLNKLLSRPYWRLVYKLSENIQPCTIKNQTANFRVNTFTEFKRFRGLAGEQEVIQDVLGSLKPEDVFYDVGANVGTYTCFTASKANKVVAFEPEPQNVSRLSENIELNNIDVKIVEIALSNINGVVDLTLSGDEVGEGNHAISTNDDGRTIKVETAKGDSVVARRNIPAPTVIKIDVEGAELSVLQGFRKTLCENCRLVYVEVHPDKIGEFGAEASDIRTFLKETGFEVTELTQRGSEVFLRASK